VNNRVYNFCPGPCTLPLEVLEETQSELVDYKGSGMSIVEHSHRGKNFSEVHGDAVSLVRELLNVPEEFSILFVQGGATLQFAMTAMNLLGPSQKAGFINSGHWAKAAIADARVYGETYFAWDGAGENFTRMPQSSELEIQENTRYLHVTTNETIGGVRLFDWPKTDVPLIGDMSSDYMSRRIPWDAMDVAYGGVQKNLGPSGVALVILRKSILEGIVRDLPSYLNYRTLEESDALFNTPPVFSIYVVGKVLKYYKERGGVDEFEKLSIERCGYLYDAIDSSGGFYRCPVSGESRSRMNVVFRIENEDLEEKFIAQAESRNFANLAGHRSVGGIRASIYNSMPMEGVQKLADFMKEFRSAHTG